MALRIRGAAPSPGGRGGWSRYSDLSFYLFISPWLAIGFLGLTAIPLAYALGLSFTNFDGISRWHWVGWANYHELLGDPDTWHSLWRTALLTAITVPASIAGGLGLALLLNRRLPGIGLLRTVFYAPSIVPIVATALAFRQLFARDSGLVNAAVERLGGPTVNWLIDPTVFDVLVALCLWGLGGGMIIFLAGLQGIPPELREAAALDGVGGWGTFRNVTLPLLTPVILFQVITGVIFALQRQVEPLLLAESQAVGTGDVPQSNYLYMVNVYTQFFANQRFGYGAALLWLLFALILLITLVVFRTSALWVYYEVEQR